MEVCKARINDINQRTNYLSGISNGILSMVQGEGPKRRNREGGVNGSR
jgi:hypothetical protein